MPVLKTMHSDGICVLTISRPESLNALNQDIINQLCEFIEEIQQNNEIRGVILTGDGEKAFVAGADIKELSALGEQDAYLLSKKGQQIFRSFERSAKPILGAVNGFALGGGCELAMACHLRIASANAKFGQPEINLGTIPGYGGTQRLTQLVGRGNAFEILMTGDLLSAQEALNLGIINHVLPDKQSLMAKAFQIMEKIVSKSPITLAYLISAVNAGFSFEEAGYEEEARNFGHCAATHDFREGTSAFIEKRKPEFKGK